MLGGVLPPVVAHLMADIGEFSAKMGEAKAEMAGFATTSEARFAKLAAFGKAALLGIAATALIVGGEAVHLASNFQSAMERVHTQAGASQAEVDRLSQQVLKIAPKVGTGPEALAESLYHVESAGFRGAQAVSIMTEAAKGAAIGNANLEDVTQALIGTMASHIAGVKNADQAMAYLNSTVGIGDMRMGDLAQSISTGILPVMANAGLSIKDFGAAMATITDNATSPQVAATHLRMTIALMEAPTKKAKDALKGLGMGQYQLAHDLRKPNGLLTAVTDLRSHLAKVSPDQQANAISAIFGGGRSSATIQELLHEYDRLKSKYPALTEGTKNFADSWAKTQQTFKFQTHQLGVELETLGVKIGLKLIPWVRKAAEWLDRFGQYAMKHKGAFEVLAGVIGGVLLVAIGAYVVAMAQAAVATIAATWEILLIIAAVALVAVGVYELVKHWDKVWGWIKSTASGVWQHIVDGWHGFEAAVVRLWSRITGWVHREWDALGAWFSSAWHKVTDPIVRAWRWVESVTATVWGGIKAFFTKWWPLLLVIFAFPLAVLIAAWNHFHQAVFDVAKRVWGAVSGWLAKEWGKISDTARTVWGWVQRHINEPLERAGSKVRQDASRAWSDLTGWWHRTETSAKQVWDRVFTRVTAPVRHAWQDVRTVGSWIKRDLTGEFHKAEQELAGVGSWFEGIGQAIVHGIVHGITSVGSEVGNTLNNLANSALQSAKNFLGVNSPSRLFRDEVGHPIGEGIAVGVTASTGLAVKAAQAQVSEVHKAGLAAARRASSFSGAKVTGQVATLISHSVTGAISNPHLVAQVTGTPVVVHAHVESVAKVDGREIYRVVQKESLQYEGRNGRSGLVRQ